MAEGTHRHGALQTHLAAAAIPASSTPEELRRAASECTACELYRDATQTVFGEGPRQAPVMLVGEQPGDREDREGRPFVGPAGRLLAMALEDVGLRREEVYVTNVVKHFRFERRGKRRIHRKPTTVHIAACRPWLEAEIDAVRPRVLVCLGATAAQTLIGRDFRLTQHRGELLETALPPVVTATAHPSSILRTPDERTRRMQFEAFVADLNVVAKTVQPWTEG